MDDRALLKAYVNERSDDAFAELTRRYVDLVYSAALRQVHDPEQARDVTQGVFLILARKAESLPPATVLSGWLYRTARFVSLEAIRAEKRRRLREESMAEPSATEETVMAEETWEQVSPHLDQAMERLNESDRNAILLRFFQEKSLKEVATSFSISEEAAKKRVARALDRLRQNLSRHGISGSNSLLGTALTAYAVHPAPSAMASLIPAAVCHGATAASVQTLTTGALQMITWTKVNATAACAVALFLVAGTTIVGIHHARESQERSSLEAQRQQLTAETAKKEKRSRQMLAALETENQKLRQQSAELYRLRNTVSQLQAQTRVLASGVNSKKLDGAPPELQDAAQRLRELQFERFVAAGMKELTLKPLPEKERAEYAREVNFMKNVGLALRIYATDHGNEFPTSIDHLLATDILDEQWKKQLQDDRYEYLVFKAAETKPSLPALWWRAPDERGIRLLALNDGSVQFIREPVGVDLPGSLEDAQ